MANLPVFPLTADLCRQRQSWGYRTARALPPFPVPPLPPHLPRNRAEALPSGPVGKNDRSYRDEPRRPAFLIPPLPPARSCVPAGVCELGRGEATTRTGMDADAGCTSIFRPSLFFIQVPPGIDVFGIEPIRRIGVRLVPYDHLGFVFQRRSLGQLGRDRCNPLTALLGHVGTIAAHLCGQKFSCHR